MSTLYRFSFTQLSPIILKITWRNLYLCRIQLHNMTYMLYVYPTAHDLGSQSRELLYSLERYSTAVILRSTLINMTVVSSWRHLLHLMTSIDCCFSCAKYNYVVNWCPIVNYFLPVVFVLPQHPCRFCPDECSRQSYDQDVWSSVTSVVCQLSRQIMTSLRFSPTAMSFFSETVSGARHPADSYNGSPRDILSRNDD